MNLILTFFLLSFHVLKCDIKIFMFVCDGTFYQWPPGLLCPLAAVANCWILAMGDSWPYRTHPLNWNHRFGKQKIVSEKFLKAKF